MTTIEDINKWNELKTANEDIRQLLFILSNNSYGYKKDLLRRLTTHIDNEVREMYADSEPMFLNESEG